MLIAGQNKVAAQHELLSELDGKIGDGDHGTTMLRTTKVIVESIEKNNDKPIKAILATLGWDIMSADGGSVGPLVGSMFLGFSEAMDDQEVLDAPLFIKMVCAGIEKMHKLSKAEIGDKTMMDALLPIKASLEASGKLTCLVALTAVVVKAAQSGSDATVDMLAKYGRARNLGDKVIGHKDPGSVTIVLMFTGFAESIESI